MNGDVLRESRPEVGREPKLVGRPAALPDERSADLTRAPAPLRDVDAPIRSSALRSASKAVGQVQEVRLEVLAVRRPRHAIDAGYGASPNRQERFSEPVDVVSVVPERSELLLVASRDGTYAIEVAMQIGRPLRPGSVRIHRVPLGRLPFLHVLRGR